jgi:uncharacterized protein (DUF2164 family)
MTPIKIPREQKMLFAADIQQYLESELSERIGNLAAEALFDFVVDLAAPYIYNQAITDSRNVAMQQMDRLDEELSFLEKPAGKRR